MTASRSLHICTHGAVSFLCVAEECSTASVWRIFSVHSSVGGRLGCFQALAAVNSAAVIGGVHVPFGMTVFSGCMPRSGAAGSCGGSSFNFFLRSLHPALHRGCTSVHSPQ